jgi:UDP-N-acetylmuramoyl-tripeptide--D-alanyl-D-alanine ligase
MKGSFLTDTLSALGGHWLTPHGPPSEVQGVSIDTRTLRPGELFVAIAGPRFDGHAFIPRAAELGCAAVLASGPLPHPLPPVPVCQVPDPLAALHALTRAWVARIRPTVIGVTGSSGKTTVKEMIADILGISRRTHATPGNLNNHLGVPLTVLNMSADCQALVVEMGMNAPGEIATLAELVQPDIGVITNIQPAHMGAFATLEEIARSKAALLDYLAPDGVACLPRADPYYSVLRAHAPGVVRPFALDSVAGEPLAMRSPVWHMTAQGMEMRLEAPGWKQPQLVRVSGFGLHLAINALAAAAVADWMGVPPEEITAGLARFQAPAGRGRVRTVADGWTVVDDTYNANPGSMASALATLGRWPGSGRRVAVLGEMRELGSHSARLHAQLLDGVRAAGVELLCLAGPEMAPLHEAASRMPGLVCHYAPDPVAWRVELRPLMRPGDRILVKGSRAMRMERWLECLG